MNISKDTHPQRFLRVTHETNEHIGEEVEPFESPSADKLCAGVGGRHQHPGVYDGRKNTIQRVYGLEKKVGVFCILGGIEQVNEIVEGCSLCHSLKQELFEALNVFKVVILLGSNLALFSWRKR